VVDVGEIAEHCSTLLSKAPPKRESASTIMGTVVDGAQRAKHRVL